MKDHLVIAYHSFNDPIFKGLLLRYLQKFQECYDIHRFHIITFEQRDYLFGKKDQQEIKEDLAKSNLFWSPCRYHSGGTFILLKKVVDFSTVIWKAINISLKNKLNTIIGFTTLSGILAYCISKLLRKPVVLINVEPHSDYMKDFGIWNKSGINYRLLKYFENNMIRNGDHVAFPTQNGLNHWKEVPVKGKLYFIPTCIELKDFHFDEIARREIRNRLHINDDTRVIVYTGKFGGIYYSMEEASRTFKNIFNHNENVHFYIITPDPVLVLEKLMNLVGFKKYQYTIIGKVPYEEISKHISVGDFGILLIPSYPSQKYRCPIKTANYLACGLPFVITEGIGDDSDLAKAENVGLVLNDYENVNLKTINPSKEECQRIVRKHRHISIVVDFLNKVLS